MIEKTPTQGATITPFAWQLGEPGGMTIFEIEGTMIALGGNYDVGVGKANSGREMLLGWN